MQPAAYLDRLALASPPSPDASGLLQVQAAHRQRIPFENLDCMLGRDIDTASMPVFDKLVAGQRGGFCFEHNRLLSDMLGQFGFANRLLLARVLLGNPPVLQPRTHCLLLVTLDGSPWIADAGFGAAYAPPMPLRDGELATSGDGASHRLRRIGEEGALPGSWLLERRGPRASGDGRARSDDDWEPQFAFDLAEVADADLALGSFWAATHPAARFTNVTVVSRCLPDGFASLVDRDYSVWRAGQDRRKHTIGSPGEYRQLLVEEFGIDLSATEIQALPLFGG